MSLKKLFLAFQLALFCPFLSQARASSLGCVAYNQEMKCVRWKGGYRFSLPPGDYCAEQATLRVQKISLLPVAGPGPWQQARLYTDQANESSVCEKASWYHVAPAELGYVVFNGICGEPLSMAMRFDAAIQRFIGRNDGAIYSQAFCP